MKTLKSILAGIALLFVCAAANAAVKTGADKPTKTDVVNMYIDAVAHGNTKNLANILDNSMEYDVQRGDNVNALNKDQLLETLKNSGTSDASVTTNSTVLTDDDDTSVVRVDFKYADFVRTDIVTLSKSRGWQITKVVSSFK